MAGVDGRTITQRNAVGNAIADANEMCIRDRVKEAMFSIVQFDLPGARVLDLYAGSGQLGIEKINGGRQPGQTGTRGLHLSLIHISSTPAKVDW